MATVIAPWTENARWRAVYMLIRWRTWSRGGAIRRGITLEGIRPVTHTCQA